MRWEHNEPELGDMRWRSGFLFFPRRIKTITRWLEFATYEQIYDNYNGWVDTEWIA